MNLNHFHILTAAILCVYTFPLAAWLSGGANREEADVVIYGGTSAGVMAAVQVRRMGKSCVLIEPGHHLGGLSSRAWAELTPTTQESSVVWPGNFTSV